MARATCLILRAAIGSRPGNLARHFQNGSPQNDWLRALREVGRQSARLRAFFHANSTL
jgi:hypothetical protein